MALIKCPECKKKISDQCENCPNCGYPINKSKGVDSNQKINTVVTNEETTAKKPFNIKSLFKKWWFGVVLGVVIVAITITMIVLLMPCNHEWIDATCENPVTCSRCGEIAGKATGHTWNEASCTAAKTCLVCKKSDGEALEHQWNEATCTLPKTCSVCKKSDGEALGHQWNEATCTLPKTCSVCNKTDGEALGHDWINATYSKPKTCKTCNKTEGNALISPEEKVVGTYRATYLNNGSSFSEVLTFSADGTVKHTTTAEDDKPWYGTWTINGSTLKYSLSGGEDCNVYQHTAQIVSGGISTDNLFYKKIY